MCFYIYIYIYTVAYQTNVYTYTEATLTIISAFWHPIDRHWHIVRRVSSYIYIQNAVDSFTRSFIRVRYSGSGNKQNGLVENNKRCFLLVYTCGKIQHISCTQHILALCLPLVFLFLSHQHSIYVDAQWKIIQKRESEKHCMRIVNIGFVFWGGLSFVDDDDDDT